MAGEEVEKQRRTTVIGRTLDALGLRLMEEEWSRRETLSRAHEVAGEEDRQAQLRQLARLEREEAHVDPDVGVSAGASAPLAAS